MSGDTIRLLTPDDGDFFRRIRLEALRTEPSAFASRVEDWEELSPDEWRRRLTETPVFVAFRDDDPVGVMGLMRQRSTKMAHRATIIMVYVGKALRGAGIAAKLLEAVTDHAREIGVRQLELAVTAENPAAYRFYEREGFAEIGRVPGGFLQDGREIDEILMARRIVA
jgi:RimJ/RimL family protein N-acetyltransferase